jgi:hypothetical protein
MAAIATAKAAATVVDGIREMSIRLRKKAGDYSFADFNMPGADMFVPELMAIFRSGSARILTVA